MHIYYIVIFIITKFIFFKIIADCYSQILGVLICHFQVINVSDKNFYRRLKLIAILKYKKTEIATAVGSNCLRTRTCLLTHATI